METPSIFWIKDYKKHNAWMSLKGKSNEDSRKLFIKVAEALLAVGLSGE